MARSSHPPLPLESCSEYIASTSPPPRIKSRRIADPGLIVSYLEPSVSLPTRPAGRWMPRLPGCNGALAKCRMRGTDPHAYGVTNGVEGHE